MLKAWSRVARYSRAWSKGTERVTEEETSYRLGETDVPGTVYLSTRGDADLVESRPGPAWLVMHGVTVPGRKHESLIRFARALAASPATVFTPEIPQWTALKLDPDLTRSTIAAAITALAERPEVDPRRVGLVGFSFGAPQALIAAADPTIKPNLRTVVGFGGYADLHRILRFLFTGIHEWQGVEYDNRPDPYGRWIVGANFLTGVPGFEDAQPLAEALHELASLAGQRRIASWDPAYDGVKAEMRAALPSGLRGTFDLFAPPADRRIDAAGAGELIDQLYESIRQVAPGLDPGPSAHGVDAPVHLIHGRDDPLVPFTETLRMSALLREAGARGPVHETVTSLFAHSGEGERAGPVSRAIEGLALARALGRVFVSV